MPDSRSSIDLGPHITSSNYTSLHFPDAKKKRVYNKRDWVKVNSGFKLSEEEWCEIFDKENRKLVTGTNVDFFADKINSFGIPCVLAADHKKSQISISLVFYCLHSECTRLYNIRSKTLYNELELYFCGDKIHGITRPLSGKARMVGTEKIATMTPKQYYTECCAEADKNLKDQGNLQKCKSTAVLNLLKHQALAAGDFDRNQIIDLIKMKKKGRSKREGYRRRTIRPVGVSRSLLRNKFF